MKYETIYEPSCLSEEQIQTLYDGWHSMKALMADYWEGRPVHMTEFQTLGFWHHRDDIPLKKTEYEDELLHVEYTPLDHWRARHPENYPRFGNWIKRKKHIFDVEAFHYYMSDLIHKKLPEIGREIPENGKIHMLGMYDLNFNFETHTDGRDVLCKKDTRTENFDFSSMKPEQWLTTYDSHIEYTHQGLIPIDVSDYKDGTIIFDQEYDYSTYFNMGRGALDKDWLENEDRKQMIKFGKGDSLERYGAKVRNYTDKPMSQEDYDWVMENCPDETDFPIEHGYGLSVETICEFNSPGTWYDWQTNKYHKTRPRIVKGDERRVTLVYSFANFN